MEITYNWNQRFIHHTKNLGKFELCLEIGCFEGLTSNYICDNLLSHDGKLICVDPLSDDYLTENLSEKDVENNKTIYKYFNGQHARFTNNVGRHIENNKIELHQSTSFDAFPSLIEKYGNQIGLIYIDGDHRASAVYLDAVNSFALCKPGGYILFDDYNWGEQYNEESTNKGIDKFLDEYKDSITILIKSDQVLIQKK